MQTLRGAVPRSYERAGTDLVVLAHFIHEHFCCNRIFAATTGVATLRFRYEPS
jgi:hypothetical protein